MATLPGAEVERQLYDLLVAKEGAVRSVKPVGGGAQDARVWRAVTASGRVLAVKQHAHAGAAEMEFGVLRMLHGLGAPVVRPVRVLAPQRVVVTEWLEFPTVADLVLRRQESPADSRRSLSGVVHDLVRGCAALETAFTGLAARLRLDATGERERRHSEVRQRCRRAYETHVRLATSRLGNLPSGWQSGLRREWAAVANALCAGRLTLGGRDCTPNNVLAGGDGVRFLDFAVLGLDWPEARLAQYAAVVHSSARATAPATAPATTNTTALATAHSSLLTLGQAQWYVDSEWIDCAQLDLHHVLLWSEAMRLIMDETLGAGTPNSNARDDSLRQALQVALTPVAATSPARPIRARLAAVYGGEA